MVTVLYQTLPLHYKSVVSRTNYIMGDINFTINNCKKKNNNDNKKQASYYNNKCIYNARSLATPMLLIKVSY